MAKSRPFDGKRIVVTGATDGIGLVTAEHLARLGARGVLHGRNPDRLVAAGGRIGGDVETIQADLLV